MISALAFFELPATPMILFFVDGLREDVLEELDRRGELPRLHRYLFDRAAHVRSAVTSVPSVTYANSKIVRNSSATRR